MEDYQTTRRGTLAAIGTAILGGCTTENGPQPQEQNDPPNEDNTGDAGSSDEQDKTDEGGDDPDEEDDETEQNNSWNWENVLEKEQEYNQGAQIDNLAERALEGEKIGTNLKDMDNTRYRYSFGGQTWNLEAFLEHNLDKQREFMNAVNDALTLPTHWMHTKEGGYASRFKTQMGATAELILEGGHDADNLQVWGWGNDGHGFNYILSEDHGVFTVDTATSEIGRAGTNPLQDAPYGNDIISQYKDTWIKESSDVNGFKANLIQNFLTNGVYSTSQRVNENAVGYDLERIPDLVEKYKSEDSGEFLWNVHRPAVATTVNRLARDIDEEEKLIMINPDSIEDLPDLRNFDNFQNYKTELEQYTEVMDYEEEDNDINLQLEGSLPEPVAKEEKLGEKMNPRHFAEYAL